MANTPAAGTEVFKRSPKPTVGIEWEVALINPETWDLAHQAEAVIATAQQIQPDIHLEKEFLQNTIELVTGICDSIPQAVAELDRDLAVIRQAAEHHGLVLWASGGHPFSDFRTNPVSAKMTYAEIIERTQYWGSQMLIWGTRARRHQPRRPRVADHQRHDDEVPAPAGAVRVLAGLGWHRYWLCLQPHHVVPTAADGGPATGD